MSHGSKVTGVYVRGKFGYLHLTFSPDELGGLLSINEQWSIDIFVISGTLEYVCYNLSEEIF